MKEKNKYYSNGIRKPDHMASNIFSTIWISDKFGIQIPTVLFCLVAREIYFSCCVTFLHSAAAAAATAAAAAATAAAIT